MSLTDRSGAETGAPVVPPAEVDPAAIAGDTETPLDDADADALDDAAARLAATEAAGGGDRTPAVTVEASDDSEGWFARHRRAALGGVAATLAVVAGGVVALTGGSDSDSSTTEGPVPAEAGDNGVSAPDADALGVDIDADAEATDLLNDPETADSGAETFVDDEGNVVEVTDEVQPPASAETWVEGTPKPLLGEDAIAIANDYAYNIQETIYTGDQDFQRVMGLDESSTDHLKVWFELPKSWSSDSFYFPLSSEYELTNVSVTSQSETRIVLSATELITLYPTDWVEADLGDADVEIVFERSSVDDPWQLIARQNVEVRDPAGE